MKLIKWLKLSNKQENKSLPLNNSLNYCRYVSCMSADTHRVSEDETAAYQQHRDKNINIQLRSSCCRPVPRDVINVEAAKKNLEGTREQEGNKCWYSSTAHPLWALLNLNLPSTDGSVPSVRENRNFHEGNGTESQARQRPCGTERDPRKKALTLELLSPDKQPDRPRGKKNSFWQTLWLSLIQKSHENELSMDRTS